MTAVFVRVSFQTLGFVRFSLFMAFKSKRNPYSVFGVFAGESEASASGEML
jgi:hypothetical protein